MHRPMILRIQGGNTHILPLNHLEALQEIVAGLGAEAYPLFLRVGGSLQAKLQPVTSRTLLAEIEHFLPRLAHVTVPCLMFRDAAGQELGGMHGRSADGTSVGSDTMMTPTESGICMLLRQFPPPVGFRSRPELPSGYYECYFRQITCSQSGCEGIRTEAMGGSGVPVLLPDLPLPPITRWDFARTSGKPSVALIEAVMNPVGEVYRDVLHALESACNDSLRLKAQLQIRKG
jgi:hypothetical protein